jgi:hypothetical protein
MPSAPAPKSPLSEVLAQRQTNVQPPVGESVVTSSDINGPPVKDGPPHLDHAPVGRFDVGIDPKESTANTSAPVDAQRPAEGSNAMAVATSSHAPALATAAASALTASQTPPPVPVQSGLVRPDGTPIEAKSSDSAASPREATKPNEKAATAAGVRAESARQPAAKIDSATRPPRDKMSARKNIAKTEKARAEPTAEKPYSPPRPAQPEKAVVSPAAQTVADSAVAAPTAPTPPTSFAAQSVGQLTNAFVYLTHLPGALIEHATGPSTEVKVESRRQSCKVEASPTIDPDA